MQRFQLDSVQKVRDWDVFVKLLSSTLRHLFRREGQKTVRAASGEIIPFRYNGVGIQNDS